MEEKFKTYVVSVFIALAVGILASYFSADGMQSLYATINKPSLAPPAIIFPMVWTALYFLMGISAGMIWAEKCPEKAALRRRALWVYALSLAVNFSWCFIFFEFRAFGFAFAWILLLFALVVKTIYEYRKINPQAAYLQIPYALWICFAGYLTCAVWVLNR